MIINEKMSGQKEISAIDRHERKRVKILDTEMSYVESGQGEPIVFLHGNPTSSYLWRNIIPYLSDHARCLAPDLVGMGHSGKSPSASYTFLDHSKYLDAWFNELKLDRNVTLVLHDWGSALGFYWAHRNAEKIRAIVYMEAIVQPRLWSDFPNGRDAIFRALRSEKGEQMIFQENFFIETVLPKSVIRPLIETELNVYREPFIQKESRTPMLEFPRQLPIEGEPANVAGIVEQYSQWLSKSTFPKLLISAQPGALLTGRSLEFVRTWLNQIEVTVKGIHYIQEDSPNEIGSAIQHFFLRLEK